MDASGRPTYKIDASVTQPATWTVRAFNVGRHAGIEGTWVDGPEDTEDRLIRPAVPHLTTEQLAAEPHNGKVSGALIPDALLLQDHVVTARRTGRGLQLNMNTYVRGKAHQLCVPGLHGAKLVPTDVRNDVWGLVVCCVTRFRAAVLHPCCCRRVHGCCMQGKAIFCWGLPQSTTSAAMYRFVQAVQTDPPTAGAGSAAVPSAPRTPSFVRVAASKTAGLLSATLHFGTADDGKAFLASVRKLSRQQCADLLTTHCSAKPADNFFIDVAQKRVEAGQLVVRVSVCMHVSVCNVSLRSLRTLKLSDRDAAACVVPL